MTQWLNRSTRSACLFMRHACLTGVLLAALAGCNDGGGGQKQAQSTFDVGDNTKVPESPVVGTVDIVPGTDTSPPHVDSAPARDECDTSKPWFGFEPWTQQYIDMLKRCTEKRGTTGVTGSGKAPEPFDDPFGRNPGLKAAHDAINSMRGRDDIRIPPQHIDTQRAADECDSPSEVWKFGEETKVDELLQLFERCSEKREASRKDDGGVGPAQNHDPKPFDDPFGRNPGLNAAHDAINSMRGHDDLRMPAGRFIETAPDTIGGATFESSPTYQYDLGNLVARYSTDRSGSFASLTTFVTPIKGWVRYPERRIDASDAPANYPVIIFLHGQHSAADPSYQGYDYLAKDLAEHGYVVLSIDANAINTVGDDSSYSRAQLVLGTLDRMRQIDGFGQVDFGGNLGKLDPLKGKLDFTRVGIMGHSRGGQAVANTVVFNKTRRGVTEADFKTALMASPGTYKAQFPDLAAAFIPKTTSTPASVDTTKYDAAMAKYNIFYAAGSDAASYDFKGVFMLAPTDFAGVTGLDHVPLANLLPSCDGDVWNLQGARAFDHNRFGPADDTTPRYQMLHRGANHNFYNTIWSARDAVQNTCKFTKSYLGADEQRRGGRFIIESFMRYHVGDEQKFASYWNNLAHLPKPACPFGKALCDERVVVTVQKHSAGSKLIQRFDDEATMKQNKLGGEITFTGFDQTKRFDMVVGGTRMVPLLDGFGDIMSLADHVELYWTNEAATITNDMMGISAAGFDTLTFRVAVALPVGQEVLVTLTDNAGKSATVTASDYTDALYNFPRPKTGDLPMVDNQDDAPLVGDTFVNVLSMVAIPLRAFNGIDTTNLKELKFTFPKEWGKVALTDIELQDFGRDKLACEVAMPKPDWCRTAPQVAGSTPQQTAQPENKDKLLLINN